MVDTFDDEYIRWAEGHAASAAAFLADSSNILINFSVETGEHRWYARTDNVIDTGVLTQGLNGYTDEVGNDVIAPLFIPGRTTRQIDWMLTNRFDGGNRSELATVGVFDQDRGVWDVYTCIATWETSNSINNRYRDLIVTFAEAEVLA